MPYKISGKTFYLAWEVAEMYGCTDQTVRNYIQRDLFRGVCEFERKKGTRKPVAFLIPAREVHRVMSGLGYSK